MRRIALGAQRPAFDSDGNGSDQAIVVDRDAMLGQGAADLMYRHQFDRLVSAMSRQGRDDCRELGGHRLLAAFDHKVPAPRATLRGSAVDRDVALEKEAALIVIVKSL